MILKKVCWCSLAVCLVGDYMVVVGSFNVLVNCVASTTAVGHVLLQYMIYKRMAENEAFTRKGSLFASRGQAVIDLPLPPITTKRAGEVGKIRSKVRADLVLT